MTSIIGAIVACSLAGILTVGLALGSLGCENDSSTTQHKNKKDTYAFASWPADKKQDIMLYSDACQNTFFPDKDGDGYGDKSGNIFACEKPEGYVDNFLDCDDNNLYIAPSAKEICDLKDNNCDNVIDESGACICIDNDFDSFPLYSVNDCPIGNDCDDENKYVHPNMEEVSDGTDNDCDGSIDEGFSCNYGATQKCGFTDIGKCEYGIQTCTNGTWGPCLGEIKSMPEECDYLDNNCDGKTDENLTKACSNICGGGVETCVNGSWLNCNAPAPVSEICDGKDNDCDGKIDETLEKYVGCGPNGDGQQKQVCNTGSWVNSGSCLGGGVCQNSETLDQLCGSDTGECQKGTQYKTCSNGQWGSWGVCQGEVKSKNETCNNKDDDCDGSIDESLTQTCSSTCGSGIETCVSGVWKNCNALQPSAEICDDKDNDCDGKVDEISDCIACDAYKNYSLVNGKCCTNGKTKGTLCIIDSFELPKGNPRDLAWDWNEKVLWYIDDSNSSGVYDVTLYKTSPKDGNLNILSSFKIKMMPSIPYGLMPLIPTGLAWTGEYLYVYDTTLDMIFSYTPNGVMDSSFELGSVPEGISYEGCMSYDGNGDILNGEGMEWDGQYLWITSKNASLSAGKICQITTSGQVIKSFEFNVVGMNNPKGVTIGKNLLWINNSAPLNPAIYVMSMDSGEILNSYSTPTTAPYGLTLESKTWFFNYLWYSTSFDDKIYKLEVME